MPRFPERKTNKGSFKSENMREAVDLVIGGKSIRSVAKDKGLAVATLARYVTKQKAHPEENIRTVPNYGVRKIFSSEQENTLVDYILTCSKMFYGLSMMDIRKLAFAMAEKKIN